MGHSKGRLDKLHKEELYDIMLFTEYYLGDEIKKDGMGETSNTHGSYEEQVQNLVGQRDGGGYFKVEAPLFCK